MSLFVGFYIVSLLAICQLIGLILLVRAINRLCDAVSRTTTVTVVEEKEFRSNIATIVEPRAKPAGAPE